MKMLIGLSLAVLTFPAVARAADMTSQILIYEGKPTKIADARLSGNGLWITTNDLALATGFHIKPQGICRDELCFPLPGNRKSEFISKRGNVTWFNLAEFARLIKQPIAHDEKNSVWLFGPRLETHENYIDTLEAPDFKLPDANGRIHSLSDYRGKKVMLITWASW